MKNLLKFAALGLALTAGLASCGSKSTEKTTVETPATGTTTTETSTMSADTTKMAADGAMAPAADGAMAPAAGTTTTTTEVKK